MAIKDNPFQKLILESFKSGLVTRMPAERIPDDAFADGENINLDDKFVPIQPKGQSKYNTSSIASAPIRGGTVYTDSSGTKYYVVACDGFVWYSIAGSRTWAKYQIGAGDMTIDKTVDVEFAQYNKKLYMTTGIYPTVTNAGNPTTRLIKIDGTTVTALTVADIPKGLKYICTFQERLFGGNSSEQSCGLFWTNAYFDYSSNNETNWTPTSGLNYDYVGKDDGETISGIKPYSGYMFVFKNKKNVYRYSISGDITQWGSTRVDTQFGCPFHRTIWELEGYLYWFSEAGVVKSDGNNCDLVDDNIRDRILALPQLKSGSLNWQVMTSTDFNNGTFGADIVDTSFDELKQKSQFSGGTFGAKVITGTSETTPNIRLLPQQGATDFGAGSLTNTLVSGESVVLQTEDYTTTYYNATNGAQQYTSQTFGLSRFFWDAGYGLNIYSISIYASSWGSPAGIGTYYSDTYNGPNPSNYIFAGTVYAGIPLNVSAHRYWMFTVSSYSAVSISPSFNYTTQQNYGRYLTSGSFVTQTLDYGQTPLDLGIMSAAYSANNGTTLTFKTRTSSDGNTWDAWVDATPGSAIASTAQRYIQVQANFTSPLATSGASSYTPVLSKIMISAPFLSKVLDYGFTPTTLGNFAVSQSLDGGSTVTYKIRVSSDGTNWDAWETITSGSAITSTVKRYVQWYALLNPSTDGLFSSQINAVLIAAQWQSEVKDLGFVPTLWGKFESADSVNSQTLTYWMRSATTSGGVSGATWYQQTPGTLITSISLYQYVQVEVRFNTTNAVLYPSMQNFKITYYQVAELIKPCAYAYRNEYCLNIADVGSTINNVMYKYNSKGYWEPKRTNKYNNIYFIDQTEIVSGTSQSDGYVRLNETGTTDDGVPPTSWFTTKRILLGTNNNIIRRYAIFSRSNNAFSFSISLNSGDWLAVDISPSTVFTTKIKSISGLNIGNTIQFKCYMALEDTLWAVQALGVEFEVGREVRNDLGAGDSYSAPNAGNVLWEWAPDGGIQPRGG